MEEKKQYIVWHDDVIVKQLISYAVGCMMGRYSIDKPGLILANYGDTVERYNELVRLSKEGEGSHSLKDLIGKYKDEWTAKFMQLHANEEELNRQFIEIYGLEDELTPDVPLDEVTILQAGEISIEDE